MAKEPGRILSGRAARFLLGTCVARLRAAEFEVSHAARRVAVAQTELRQVMVRLREVEVALQEEAEHAVGDGVAALVEAKDGGL